ncbi:MAG: YtcA family lipoprotein [Deltaproteobacteria bacterium]|nr:YtcA family lipoprotein [Deltaproteobacteria bacterium]
MRSWRQPARAALLGLGLALSGCDPVFDIEGAFFPAWMLCLLGGVIGAALLRPAFARSGLEPHLGPLPLVYSCLALLISFAAWLLFFPT